jgi:hypothetical protein
VPLQATPRVDRQANHPAPYPVHHLVHHQLLYRVHRQALYHLLHHLLHRVPTLVPRLVQGPVQDQAAPQAVHLVHHHRFLLRSHQVQALVLHRVYHRVWVRPVVQRVCQAALPVQAQVHPLAVVPVLHRAVHQVHHPVPDLVQDHRSHRLQLLLHHHRTVRANHRVEVTAFPRQASPVQFQVMHPVDHPRNLQVAVSILAAHRAKVQV